MTLQAILPKQGTRFIIDVRGVIWRHRPLGAGDLSGGTNERKGVGHPCMRLSDLYSDACDMGLHATHGFAPRLQETLMRDRKSVV